MNVTGWLGSTLGYLLLFVASVALLWGVSLLAFGVVQGFSGDRVGTLGLAAGTALIAGILGSILLRAVGGGFGPATADAGEGFRDGPHR